ncbi:uncharacterized protein [Panulirus ornatus]|uniref:uncharacterized protein n=1 Tax=Panulirus ornatus TaxID=150431 RepID=UPI003A839407
MYATVTTLLACLICVSANPAPLLPGYAAGATTLDCTLAGDDPVYPYRCRPVLQEALSARQDKGQSSEESVVGSEEAGVVPTIPRQMYFLAPNCGPRQVFNLALNMCQDVIPHPLTRVTSLGDLIIPRYPVYQTTRDLECGEGQIPSVEVGICMEIDPQEPIRSPTKKPTPNKPKNKPNTGNQ